MAGAVIFGKTVTAEFAGSFPGATTNPYNRAHTPGGSSSGSAAAVADFMIPAALGTQTGGSVLRPSSYCGIIGFKPSFDTFNLGGVKPAAQALDTLGLHARSIDDIALLADVLVGRPPKPIAAPSAPPVIGLCRTPLWPAALPETVAAIEDATGRLAAAGAQLREIDLPDEFGGLNEARETINAYERGRLMAFEWSHHRAQLSEMLRGTLQQGYEMAYDDYVAAIRLGERCRAMMPGIFGGIDVILAPAADGAAPVSLKSAGNARFQGIWTFMHLPAITLPTHLAPGGLPVGIQLVAPHREDDRLLAAASWVLGTLGAATDLG
jgi:amidase